MMKTNLDAIVHGARTVFCALILVAAAGLAPTGTAQATQAAVAAPDRYGADVAGEILDAGGNAADATVAVAFALAVTFPEAGNLGGGGLATIRFGGKNYFLDYRERAPRRASAGMYLDAHGEVIKDSSTVGALAAGVPGTVMGLWELHKRFGKLPWARDVAPAVKLARDGFVVSEVEASRAAAMRRDLNGRTNFTDYFDLKPGEHLRQPELAATLARIAKSGPTDFYHGKTAQLLVREMTRSHGLVDARDLAAYKAVWREPLVAKWAGYDVVTAPPPSSGGIALIQLLKMREDAAARFEGVTLNSPQYVHLIAELAGRILFQVEVGIGIFVVVSGHFKNWIAPVVTCAAGISSENRSSFSRR